MFSWFSYFVDFRHILSDKDGFGGESGWWSLALSEEDFVDEGLFWAEVDEVQVWDDRPVDGYGVTVLGHGMRFFLCVFIYDIVIFHINSLSFDWRR